MLLSADHYHVNTVTVSLNKWTSLSCVTCCVYLPDLLQSQSDDVRDDDPLLQRRPSLHLYQDDVIVQHEVHQVGDLRHTHISHWRSWNIPLFFQLLLFIFLLVDILSFCSWNVMNSFSVEANVKMKELNIQLSTVLLMSLMLFNNQTVYNWNLNDLVWSDQLINYRSLAVLNQNFVNGAL